MDKIRELARLGARMRLEQINNEKESIESLLSSLDEPPPKKAARERPGRKAGEVSSKRRRRNLWTAEARKAVSERMKKYWAQRRAENLKKRKSRPR